MKKFLAMLLAIATMLSLSVSAGATEAVPAVDPLDMKLEIDGKVYTLSGTLKDITAQGITVSDSEVKEINKAILVHGFWYPASVGDTQFLVLLSENRLADDVYVSGIRTNQVSSPDAEAVGLQLGKSTAKDVRKLFGDPDKDENTSIFYWYKHQYAFVEFQFESDKKNAPLKSIEVADATPFLYGAGVSEAAGKEDKNLPDPEELQEYAFILDGKLYTDEVMVTDLMENGWRISAYDVDKEWEPRSATTVGSHGIWMYNGIGFIEALVYNDSMTEPCSTMECKVRAICVNASDGISIWVEKGFSVGAELKDVQKAFDDIETDKRDGYTDYIVSDGKQRIRFSVADKTAFAVWAYLPIQFNKTT